TLDKLVAKNIIYKTNFGDAESYFEYQRNHHHHIICSSCGKREEVRSCLEKSFKEIEKELKKFNKVNSHMLELFGVCKVCSNS
ncbi:MAG: transcriptional repressor, partial [Candidatus Paceibacterota bacterium]